jgi:hypothetical protein
MIEVKNINPINKGSLLASCDVRIAPWKITLLEVKIFEKGANRWISLPSKEVVNAQGKRYVELISFDNEAMKNRFRDQVMKSIDDYLLQNPEMKVEDVITESEDLPF